MAIFIPTILINLIGFSSHFFKWFDFQNRIMVTITSLLVLAAMFSQIHSTLPTTSYMKLIDVWFFISISYCFVSIAAIVIIDYTHKYNNYEDIASKTKEDIEFEIYTAGVYPKKPFAGRSLMFGLMKQPVSRDPYYIPKRLDKIFAKAIIISYIMISIIFWSVAIAQIVKYSNAKLAEAA